MVRISASEAAPGSASSGPMTRDEEPAEQRPVRRPAAYDWAWCPLCQLRAEVDPSTIIDPETKKTMSRPRRTMHPPGSPVGRSAAPTITPRSRPPPLPRSGCLRLSPGLPEEIKQMLILLAEANRRTRRPTTRRSSAASRRESPGLTSQAEGDFSPTTLRPRHRCAHSARFCGFSQSYPRSTHFPDGPREPTLRVAAPGAVPRGVPGPVEPARRSLQAAQALRSLPSVPHRGDQWRTKSDHERLRTVLLA